MLALFAVLLLAADQKGENQKPPVIGPETSEILRQTFAKVTAYGERARVCATVMNNDQNQIRDVQAKIRDAQDRISTLTRDGQKLQSTTPRGNVLTAELNNINTQINNTKGFSAKLSQQETALNSDIADQKKCIDVAQSGLNSILANPAQPILDQKKK